MTVTSRCQTRGVHELLTPTETQRADQIAVADGVSFEQLVDRAGRAVAAAAMQFSPRAVLVIAGPGNNGADGIIADERLRRDGVASELRRVDPADPASVRDAIEAVRRLNAAAGQSTLIIDALFGAGLNREVSGGLVDLIDAINASTAAVLAVDVPSGLDGATGQPLGAAVEATATITFFRKKPGHLLVPGRYLCGPVTVADVGIPEDAIDGIGPRLWENSPDLWVLPVRRADGHKYSAGHCVVASGGRWQTGASRLAAWAALRIGAGAVTIAGPPAALDVHAAHVTAVMLTPAEHPADLAAAVRDRRAQSVVAGPALGVGATTREMVTVLLGTDAAVVLDADALSSWEGSTDAFTASICSRAAPVVLTPHAAEFERLFPMITAASKVERARAAASMSGAVMVSKGADTVVAAPDGRAVINTNAPPSLATAGSGDVLAGIIGGLLAQGMDAFDAAAAGVFEHGAAASRGPTRLTAISLLDAI